MLCGQTRRNAQGKAKAKSKHLGGSAQSGSAAGSAEVGCEEVVDPNSSSSSDESFGSSSSSSSSSEAANIREIVKAHTIRVPLSVGPGFCREQRAVESHYGVPGISAGMP